MWEGCRSQTKEIYISQRFFVWAGAETVNLLMDKEYCDKGTGRYVKMTSQLRFTNKWILGVFRRHSTWCTLASHVDRIIPSPSSVIDNRLLGDGILSVFDEEKGTTNFWYNRRIECYVLLTRFIEDSKVGIRMWLLNTLWLAALYESVQT